MKEPQGLPFNNLPKDIIFDIFSRIPLKFLYQLRCVSKNWQFLLDLDPEFRGFYHQKHKTSPNLLFTLQNTETPSTTQLSSYHIDGTQLDQFSTIFPQPLTTILTCHGILCLISNTKLLLYDPIIKRVSILPNPTSFSSTYSWAFGFSPSHNIFKLVRFYTIEKFDNFHYCQVKEVMCEIISTKSSQLGLSIQQDWSWRYIGKCPFDILGRKDYANVNGKFYWLIAEKKHNPECIKIMSFDLETENFGMVCFPRTYSNRSIECLDLVEIKDKLCLTDRLPWESTMIIWMMVKEEDGFTDFWVKMYEIDLMGIVHHDVKILGHLGKIKVNNYDGKCESEDEGEGEIFMKIGEESFGLYELESGEFRELAGQGIISSSSSMQGLNLELMIHRKLLL